MLYYFCIRHLWFLWLPPLSWVKACFGSTGLLHRTGRDSSSRRLLMWGRLLLLRRGEEGKGEEGRGGERERRGREGEGGEKGRGEKGKGGVRGGEGRGGASKVEGI